ncbi:hypothetical protein UlMin_014934 [Ulmus minor]
MGEESNAFYVVRKGDVIGIYKSFADCQAQAGSSVCDPSISVFKGYGLPKEAEDYLVSRGLKNASYAINANDVKSNLFGELVGCPYQQPASSGVITASSGVITGAVEIVGSSSVPAISQSKHLEVVGSSGTVSSSCHTCSLFFDGASKGNPGMAGAGAVLYAEDGTSVCYLREGVGFATNNAAEYRAVILGLRHALKKGFKHIYVRGDSKLVVMQMQGLWKIKNPNMADLCKVAKELAAKFISFQITHVLRESNSDADVQANQAIYLKDGQVEEDCKKIIL